ncbi:MAG: prepilin-type N-terminal cleavage/methylation domain-containing protein, partial [Desulfobacteraceae bacterium]
MRKIKRKFGFTIIELVVVIAILSIVASIAGWGVNAMMPVFRIRSASMEMKSDMQLARLEAIRHNTFVVSH